MFHLDCLKLSEDETDRIEDFYCTECENILGELTSWKGRDPVGQEIDDKEQNYWEAEKIKDLRVVEENGEEIREFLIKGKNYPEDKDSWEPEKHLDGCVDTPNNFRKLKGKSLSKLESLFGASGGMKSNSNNYVTMSMVIKQIESYQNSANYKTSLEVREWNGFENSDKIYLYGYKKHLFVFLYSHEKRIGIHCGRFE